MLGLPRARVCQLLRLQDGRQTQLPVLLAALQMQQVELVRNQRLRALLRLDSAACLLLGLLGVFAHVSLAVTAAHNRASRTHWLLLLQFGQLLRAVDLLGGERDAAQRWRL